MLIYDVSCKSSIVAEPLRIRFDKIDGFRRTFDGTTY